MLSRYSATTAGSRHKERRRLSAPPKPIGYRRSARAIILMEQEARNNEKEEKKHKDQKENKEGQKTREGEKTGTNIKHPAKRKMHTDSFDMLRENLKENLFRLLRMSDTDPRLPQNADQLSKRIGWSKSTVSRWIKKDTLPKLDQAYELANYYNITIDELISPRTAPQDYAPQSDTYFKAFLELRHLHEKGIIDYTLEGIKDPFLKYLLTESARIESIGSLSFNEKNAWYEKVANDYSRPVMPASVTRFFDEFYEDFERIEKYDSYLAIFDYMESFCLKTKDDPSIGDQLDMVGPILFTEVLEGPLEEFQELMARYEDPEEAYGYRYHESTQKDLIPPPPYVLAPAAAPENPLPTQTYEQDPSAAPETPMSAQADEQVPSPATENPMPAQAFEQDPAPAPPPDEP